MSRIKNVSGQDRELSWLGGRLVYAGQEVDVPADTVTAYTQATDVWEPADDEARALHEEMLAGIADLLIDQADPTGVLEHNAPEAIALIEAWSDLPSLAMLLLAEHHGKARKTVLQAIDDRGAELSYEPGDDDPLEPATDPVTTDAGNGTQED